jgi:hypothetical protein
LPNREGIKIQKDLLGTWQILFYSPPHNHGKPKLVGMTKDLAQAIVQAETFVKKERSDILPVITVSAPWRNLSPSENQINFLKRQGIPLPKHLTRGQASWMIGMLITKKK